MNWTELNWTIPIKNLTTIYKLFETFLIKSMLLALVFEKYFLSVLCIVNFSTYGTFVLACCLLLSRCRLHFKSCNPEWQCRFLLITWVELYSAICHFEQHSRAIDLLAGADLRWDLPHLAPLFFAEIGHLTMCGHPGTAVFILWKCLCSPIENSLIWPWFACRLVISKKVLRLRKCDHLAQTSP